MVTPILIFMLIEIDIVNCKTFVFILWCYLWYGTNIFTLCLAWKRFSLLRIGLSMIYSFAHLFDMLFWNPTIIWNICAFVWISNMLCNSYCFFLVYLVDIGILVSQLLNKILITASHICSRCYLKSSANWTCRFRLGRGSRKLLNDPIDLITRFVCVEQACFNVSSYTVIYFRF